jgi:hypothetical protein
LPPSALHISPTDEIPPLAEKGPAALVVNGIIAPLPTVTEICCPGTTDTFDVVLVYPPPPPPPLI